jgi:hypothetical protein
MAFNKFRSHALFRDVRREEYESNQEKNMWLVFHRHELLPWQEWINEIYCSWENSVILTFDGDSKKLMLYT